jgi:antitoxin CptB
MSDGLAARRKRLLMQSRRRGMREMDLVLGAFADYHLATFNAEQMDRYEALLGCPDPDLVAWIGGGAPVPRVHDHDVMDLLQSFKIRVPTN